MRTVVSQRQRRESSSWVVLSTWAFGRVGETLVLCRQGAHEPPDRDLEIWLERIAQPDFSKLLVHAQGSEPSARQRARITEFWHTCHRPLPRTALLTDGRAARAIMSAIELLTGSKDSKTFGLAEVDAAVQWLGEDTPATNVAEAIATMHAALVTHAVASRGSPRRQTPSRSAL